MDRRRLLALVVLFGAALHLLAHVSPSAPHLREALPEDAPALLANSALDTAPGEAGAAPLMRALTDPSAAWEPAGAVAGRHRFRPVATVLLAVERAAGGRHAARVAGWVSLLLHLGLVVLVHRVVRRLGGSPTAQIAAAALVATSPLALAAAAWPARQPAALAAVLGAAGVLLTLGESTQARSRVAPLLGGLLLGAAVLSHEAAVGLVAAAVVLRFTFGSDSGVGTRAFVVARALVPTVAALAWRAATLAPLSRPESAVGPDAFDGAVGAILTWLAPALPVRAHLADGPWEAHGGVRLIAAAVVLMTLAMLWRRRAAPVAGALLASVVACLPAVAAGAYGQAPFSATAAYVTLPIVAAALALALTAAARRGRALRTASIGAGVLVLVASSVATAARAPSHRVRAAFIERARRDAPASVVVMGWRLGSAVVTAEQAAGDERVAALGAATEIARPLAERILATDGTTTAEGAGLQRDGVAATTVATVLAWYARIAGEQQAAGGEGAPTPLDVERAGRAAVALLPQWADGWAVLAESLARLGALQGALQAADAAGDLEPESVDFLVLEGRIGLALGHAPLAVMRLGEADASAQKSGWGTPEQLRELTLLRAEALVADAATSGRLNQFETAAELLEGLRAKGDQEFDLRQRTYDLYLVWGDELASLDRTALARIAYQRAVALSGPRSWAAEHLAWLDARLARAWGEATRTLQRAQVGEGNVANALLELAIVLCRRGKWDEADAVFEKLSDAQGGMNAALRYAIAVHRHAARPDELTQAEAELRLVLKELPAFAEARFNLGGVLVQQGRLEEAREEYVRAARDGPEFEWSSEALQIAQRLAEILLLERN